MGAGVHYSDTSDEFYWQRWMIDRYNAMAEKSGARVVLSSGFCVLAGDLGSQLAIDGLQVAAGANVSMDAWLETYNGGISAGVMHTAKVIANASFPKEWNTDPYVLVPNVSNDLRMDTVVEGMAYPKYVSGEGFMVENIFGPYDARLLHRSFAHLGQKVHLRVAATPTLYAKWTAFIAEHPGSWSNLTKCPTQAIFDDGSWAYRFKAYTEERSKTFLLSGSGDPGYRFTSWGLAEVGLCLAGKTLGCLKSGSSGGVYTSMSTLDPAVLRKRLASIDLVNFKEVAEINTVSV